MYHAALDEMLRSRQLHGYVPLILLRFSQGEQAFRPFFAALWTSGIKPGDGRFAFRAAPLLFLELRPFVQAHAADLAQVRQCFRMMRYPVIVELGNSVACKVGAIRAKLRLWRFLRRAVQNFAFAAVYSNASTPDAAVA